MTGPDARRPLLTFTERGLGGRFGGLVPTLGAGAVVQVFATVAALVTVAVLVRDLGAVQFGLVVVVVALAPWLLLADGSLYPTTRLLAGEARSRATFRVPASLVAAAARLALVLALTGLAVVVLATLVLPVARLVDSDLPVTTGELRMAILAFAVPVVLSGPGGVRLGALEAVGRTGAASLIWGYGPLVALPLTLVSTALGHGLVGACAAQGLGVAAPRFTAWIYWHVRPSVETDDGRIGPALGAIRPVALQMLIISTTILVATGLDPLIVSAVLGAEAAAELGLVTRVAGGALIPLTVVSPLLSSNIASARADGWGWERDRDLRRLVLRMTVAGALLAACVVLLGPLLVRLLAGDAVTPSLSLYVAAAAFVWTSVLGAPLALAFSGPQALRRATVISIVLALANVTATWLLVPRVGVSAPLWATAGASLLTSAYWWLTWRRHSEWLAESHHPAGVQ